MHVALIGTQSQSLDYARYAVEAGIDCRFIGHSDGRLNSDIIATQLSNSVVDDVIAFTDPDQLLTDQVKQVLGLPHRPLATLKTLIDKQQFKHLLHSSGFISDYIILQPQQDNKIILRQVAEMIGFPCVLKPSKGFYSSGVIRVDKPEAMEMAIKQVRRVIRTLKNSTGQQMLIAERYIDGDEYAVDGFVVDGKLMPLVVYHKYPRLTGPTFHETCYLSEPLPASICAPSSVNDSLPYKAFTDAIAAVIRMVGLDNSPFHAEIRVDEQGKVYILEVAPRLSGGGATGQQLLNLSLGINAYAVLHAVNCRHFNEKLLKPRWRRWAMEYDFSVEKSGVLNNIAVTAALLEQYPSSQLIQYKTDGDYVIGPPYNLETILTLFCQAADRNQAIEQYHQLKSIKLEVV